MKVDKLYPNSYEEARQRFRQEITALDGALESHAIHVNGFNADALTIDVGILGASAPKWAVIATTGIHGVEGYFGSAIQTAWLRQVSTSKLTAAQGCVVLVHALNPYGFAQLRRTNEDNADLNRNFLFGDARYKGAPEGYAELNPLLNPASPPPRFDLFLLQALGLIVRSGLATLKNVVAKGQYEYPQGLFYGGPGPAQSTVIVQENIERWIRGATDIVHVDFHSGLGKYGQYKLLLSALTPLSAVEWYQRHFGTQFIEPADHEAKTRTAYEITGMMGDWIMDRLSDRRYRFFAAEFGTYWVLRVVTALRRENRAHFYSEPNHPEYRRAKAELLECFCPARKSWREAVLKQGVAIMEQCVQSVTGQD